MRAAITYAICVTICHKEQSPATIRVGQSDFKLPPIPGQGRFYAVVSLSVYQLHLCIYIMTKAVTYSQITPIPKKGRKVEGKDIQVKVLKVCCAQIDISVVCTSPYYHHVVLVGDPQVLVQSLAALDTGIWLQPVCKRLRHFVAVSKTDRLTPCLGCVVSEHAIKSVKQGPSSM